MDLRHSVLVLGGARSGKSRYAEERIAMAAADKVYIATAEALDNEMSERVRLHQDRRGPDWRTIEAPLDLPGALEAHAGPGRAILVDCLTLWLSNLMGAGCNVAGEVGRLAETLPSLAGTVVLVSNEVGMGIVPENPLARAYRDEAGLAHQMLAAVCDEVIFVAAGLPLKMKG
jgi:adenosylcobinamide kinase/adenosylcobinamide-phosphate guanylyltransferase